MTNSHAEFIDLWPSIREFSLDIGASYNTAKHIRRRGLVPPRYWARMIDGASRRGIGGVTADRLMIVAEIVADARRGHRQDEAA